MKNTVRTIRKMKQEGEKIAVVTAYDAPGARLAAAAGVDMILVGDSLAQGALGYADTLPVTMEDMLHHAAAVRRGAPEAFVVGDMPFLSYNLSLEQAVRNAGRVIQEAGCDAVKLESDMTVLPAVKRIVECGIPVMAHVGLLPQSLKTAGGYHVAGRSDAEAKALIATAQAMQNAGAFSVVLECVPAKLSGEITRALAVPTIGIGAGPECDGQVLVCSDVLGLFDGKQPKHAKRYAEIGQMMHQAFADYVDEVKNGTFPTAENSF